MKIKNNLLKKDLLVIGTLPPPIGGDAIWMEKFLFYLKSINKQYDFVDTSLIGKRALLMSNRKNLYDEYVRFENIKTSVIKYIKTNKYGSCHFNVNCSPFGTIRDYKILKILKKAGLKVILHCHCNIKDQIGRLCISRCYLKKLLRKSDEVIVLNKDSQNYCISKNVKNVHLIPNFIMESDVVNERTINPEVKKVLFLGHVKKTKGVLEFIECADKFPDIDFLVAGATSEEIDINKLLNDKKINNIKLLGDVHHNKVLDLLKECDLFLFPSYTEGFSLSLLEAMATGIPVIATDVGANKEMLSGGCGSIIDVANSEQLIEQVAILKAKPKLRQEYSKNSIEKVKNTYTEKIVLGEILKLYQ